MRDQRQEAVGPLMFDIYAPAQAGFNWLMAHNFMGSRLIILWAQGS